MSPKLNPVYAFACSLGVFFGAAAGLVPGAGMAAEMPGDAEIPGDVESLWADYDPRQEPLDAKVIRQWDRDGITFQYVTFTIGQFHQTRSRMAAFYGFRRGQQRLPGLLHLHGGGQRAFLHAVEYYARRGYACLSINWGGREMEHAERNDPNTDWGAVDPTQNNVSGYFNLLPGKKYLDDRPSPRNNNWYLLTIAARRGLTFLERQREVDPERLGVYGHSMGGNLTIYVAGTDRRVKVAAPSVGGSGFRTYRWPLLPQQKKQVPKGDLNLFRSTLAFQSYAPRIKCPLLWLGATNDFHGIMDDTYRTGELIAGRDVRYAFAPHLNHRFTPPFSIARPLWIDQHLKNGIPFPATPRSQLKLNTEHRQPEFLVVADGSMPISHARVYYSIDADPQARFWRSAETLRRENGWSAKLPVMSTDDPLFVFANIHYRLAKAQIPPFAQSTDTFAISSKLRVATPDQLNEANVRATDGPERVIDDFANDWRDWYRLNRGNPHHWQFWTRKISDRKWRGREGDRLSMSLTVEEANPLVVVVTENFFRSYRGKQRSFTAAVELRGGGKPQSIELAPSDFVAGDGRQRLASWRHADLLGFVPYYRTRDKPEKTIGTERWAGALPEFRDLRWLPPGRE
ncbi:MAG: acetylxylan esterase [Pirellulales bacterium]